MSKTDSVHFRTDPATKAGAEAVFTQLGVRPGDALNLFYRQVMLQQGLPFDVKVPNAETLQAFAESDAGVGLKRHASVAAMFADLKAGC
jgi:DNA-damage-inducible protein J